MKFKKDGKVFDDIQKALSHYCRPHQPPLCSGCVFRDFKEPCGKFAWENPAEAARLMGYEVVEEETGWTLAEDGDGVVCPHCGSDFCTLVYNAEEFIFCPSCGKKVKKEANMDKQSTTSQANQPEPVNYGSSKPRICEVLGVEVGERFSVKDEEAGYDSCEIFIDDSGVAQAEHRTGVIAPAILMIHAINHPASIIRKPRFTEAEVADARAIMRLCPKATVLRRTECDLHVFIDDKIFLFRIRNDLFPSILPGQSVKISYIVGGDTE